MFVPTIPDRDLACHPVTEFVLYYMPAYAVLATSSSIDEKTILSLQSHIGRLIPTLSSTDATDPVETLDLKMVYTLLSVITNRTEEKTATLERLRTQNTVIADTIKRHMQAQGRPAVIGLTYEDIVLNNPMYGMRTFTDSAIGNSERSFYRGHQIIEQRLDKVIHHMYGAMSSQRRTRWPTAYEGCQQAA